MQGRGSREWIIEGGLRSEAEEENQPDLDVHPTHHADVHAHTRMYHGTQVQVYQYERACTYMDARAGAGAHGLRARPLC